MLDLRLFASGPARGAAITMASVLVGLIRHFQYAYGWSPVRAGLADLADLADLPLIITMLAATPLSEWLAARSGHRTACLTGAVLFVCPCWAWPGPSSTATPRSPSPWSC